MSVIRDPVRDRAVVLAPLGLYPTALHVWTLEFSDPPVWQEVPTSGVAPEIWWHPAATLDPVRNRILIFGGFDGNFYRNDLWTLSLSGVPTWARVEVSGERPVGRAFTSASYDGRRDRMIVHGGRNNLFEHGLRDTWALSLSGAPVWQLVNDGAELPSGNCMHTAFCDSASDQLNVYFSLAGRGSRSDVWVLSLNSNQWFQLQPIDTIPGRFAHATCFDPARRRVLAFGGRSRSLAFPYLVDLWAMNLEGAPTWTAVAPTLPPRADAGVALDPVGQRVLVFGGASERGLFNDLWMLKFSPGPIWKELGVPGALPALRSGHSMVFDPSANRVIVFGGSGERGPLDDTWELRFADESPAWHELAVLGPRPAARSGHVTALDQVAGRMLVFGGQQREILLGDVWAFDLRGNEGWQQIHAVDAGPTNRAHAAGGVDPSAHALVVHGGRDADSLRDDTWMLALDGAPAWQELEAGAPPSHGGGRFHHGAVIDSDRRRLLIHGGLDRSGALNDTWGLDLDAGTWRELAPAWGAS